MSSPMKSPGAVAAADQGENVFHHVYCQPNHSPSIVNDQIGFSYFPDLSGSTCSEHQTTVSGLADWLRGLPVQPSKADCPLISLNRFGDQRTEKGSLRHHANLIEATGIIGDYDAGLISPQQAAMTLQLAAIRSIIVTTPSHGLKGNRWRVIAPLAQPCTIERRHDLLGRLNTLLGGILAGESFVASQAFYVGPVAGVEYQVIEVPGMPLDNLPGIYQIPFTGKPLAQHNNGSTVDPLVMSLKKAKGGIEQVRAALSLIPNTSPDWEQWNRTGMAVFNATGGSDEGLEAWRQWSSRCPIAGAPTDSVDARWQHYATSRPTQLGMGSLIQLAGGFDQVQAHQLADDVELDGHPDLSQDALARELSTAANFTADARYVPAWSSWLFWREGRWEIDQKLHHMTKVRGFLQKKASGLVEWAVKQADGLESKEAEKVVNWARSNAKALRQAGNVNAVETLARSNADLVATVDQFDANLMLLGTPGGTVDLRTGELMPAQREHYLTKQVAVTPAASGTPAPRWSAFMERIFNGDRELIDFMQRVAGYALTGSTAEHKLIFAYGTGSNGKSVFINTLFGIMADYARRAPAQTFLDSSTDRHPTDLAGLHGARLVVGSELPAGKAWNESVVKDLTGGDVITARKMRQDFFEYKPQFTLFIAGNHQPSFRGIDEAIRRRVVLVPFTQTIPVQERDLGLEEKLKAEWPTILRWMIDGAVMWGSHGLSVPQTVQAASDEYLDFEDSLGNFINDHLILNSIGSKASTADIYERCIVWQRQNGITQTWTKKAMVQALRERGLMWAKLTGGVRGFRDVALKPLPQKPSSKELAAAVLGQSGA